MMHASLTADVSADALSSFSSALKQPVHIVALLLLIVLAYELGRIAREAWRRVRPGVRSLQQITLDALNRPDDADLLAKEAPSPVAEQAVLALAHAAGTSAAVSPTNGNGAVPADGFETALGHYELQVQRRLDRTRMLVRAGPAVGLMGTLIPLAPGLSALGQGNYSLLASDLRVAFAATVVGILVGTTAFVLTLVRTRLYTEDLAALERAVALHEPQLPAHHRLEEAVGEHQA
jgi:biopolymer transport protein ExbB/TolQ